MPTSTSSRPDRPGRRCCSRRDREIPGSSNPGRGRRRIRAAHRLRSRSTAVGRTVALSWSPIVAWFIAVASLVCGLLAWFRILGASVRLVGLGRWVFGVIWALVGVAVVAAAMIGGVWALRYAREVYHPWYAHPERLFLMLLAI